jgi:phospholipid/cholesterol/gamma-HCH transport system substrate-binding protein
VQPARTVRRARAAGVTVAALVLSGCGLGQGLYNAPLPGGADLGDHPYKITADFADALDLVPQSGVKVNDVAVGRVTKITLDTRSGKTAEVQVQIRGDVKLPANAVASIQQTSLLGEKYVALGSPLDAPGVGRLKSGATIPEAHTTDGVEVEQVFGALSLVLNGGGIGQLHDIAKELNAFAHGHEGAIREFLAEVTKVVSQLNAHKDSITQALTALATLSGTLEKDNAEINRVLQSFAPGIAILAQQRNQLITMLDKLNDLSSVTVQTLASSKQNMIDDLKSLAPVLSQLAAAGSALPKSLQVLATYPFTDAALAGIKGDYLNSYVTTALNTPGGQVYAPATAIGSPGPGGSSGTGGPSRPSSTAPPSGLLPATSSAAAGLPSTLNLTPTPTGSGSGSTGSGSSGSGSTGSGSTGSGSTGSASAGSGSSGSGSTGSGPGSSGSPGRSPSGSGDGTGSSGPSAPPAGSAAGSGGGS